MNALVINFLEFAHHWEVARQPEETEPGAADATEEKGLLIAAATVDALSVSQFFMFCVLLFRLRFPSVPRWLMGWSIYPISVSSTKT